jgi:hypothetical protein
MRGIPWSARKREENTLATAGDSSEINILSIVSNCG